MRETIVALITGNISRVHEETQLLVDPGTSDGSSSGLHGPSAVLCSHLYTVRQSLAISTIGNLSDDVMQQIDDCLKAALEL